MRNEKQENLKRENCEHNKLLEEHNKLNEETQHLGKNCNALLVKYRKLMNDWNELINSNEYDFCLIVASYLVK